MDKATKPVIEAIKKSGDKEAMLEIIKLMPDTVRKCFLIDIMENEL